ncbi:MAG: hypothetical protein ACI4QH_00665 [Candidatus Fimimonas sp.]
MSASTIVVAVVVLAVITVGLFVNFGNYVTPVLGMDYVALTVNVDDFIANEKVAAGLSAEDFWIEYETANGTQRINMRSGEHTYLFTGLQPETSFTYKVFCTESQYASESEYFSQTLTTPSTSLPVGVLDEMNTSVFLDEQMKTAVLTYSVYLSDFNRTYPNTTFFVCDAPQSFDGEIANVLYAVEAPDENNFFRGEVFDVISKELYLYVVGRTDDGNHAVLFSHQLHVDIPDEWLEVNEAPFEVQEGSEFSHCTFNGIFAGGSLSKLDETATFGAYFTQYNHNGVPIEERSEAELIVDAQQKTYSVNGGAYYGVSTFSYTVFTLQDDVENIVYQSDPIQFTANQEFTGVYTKVSPSDAIVTYYVDGNVMVSVDPEFYAENPDMYYKVQVTNSFGTVFGEYCGTGAAEMFFSYGGLDEIVLVYYDCANFADGEWQYASYETEGVAFCVPQITFGNTDFDGTNFTLAYTFDMIYDYSLAFLELEIFDGENTYYQRAEGLAESGVIVLDSITSELGNVIVRGTLTFSDYTTGGDGHSLPLDAYNCNLSYSFEVTRVNADVSGSDSTVPVTVTFNAHMPQTYSVAITNDDGSVNEVVAVTEGACTVNVSASDDVQLTVSVTSKEGQVWGSYAYTVSKTEAEANYTAPSTMNCTNPGDALVTHNDDGTINIYRKINFQCSNENVYYNAYVYTFVNSGDGLVPGEGYDVIGRDTYAVIENLPYQNYYFLYHTMFDYNGVSYTMYTEMPSGGITFPENYGSYETAITDTETSVKITLSSSYGHLQNKVTVNGVDYQYTRYTDSYETYPILTIDGAIDVVSVVIYYNPNISNYEEYSQEITIKGTLYRAVTL